MRTSASTALVATSAAQAITVKVISHGSSKINSARFLVASVEMFCSACEFSGRNCHRTQRSGSSLRAQFPCYFMQDKSTTLHSATNARRNVVVCYEERALELLN